LGSLTSRVSERGRPYLPLLSVVREKGVILRSTMDDEENHNFIPDDLSNYKVVRAGNLGINKMKAWQGSLGIAPTDGIVSPAYFVFEFGIGNRRYGQALLRSNGYVAFFAQASDGVRIGQWDLSIHGMKRIPVVVPPNEEQSTIVRFLDHVDRHIRLYIRTKQKLIALLNEQKQAIIHRAVTRGLDPNVRLKHSDVEWVDNMPAHWNVLPLRRLVSLVTSGSRGWAKFYSDDGDVFLQSGNLGRSMVLDLSFIQHVKPPENPEGARTKVQVSDILVCITGALTGNVVLVDVDLPGNAFVNQHVALVRAKPEVVSPRYLAFSLYCDVGQAQFKSSEYGGTKQGLGLDDVRRTMVPLPPYEEQAAICSYLDRELVNLNAAITRINREITLLREYRTRLFADVVTGKLDVREAAANLPDEPDEPEPLDDTEDLADTDAQDEATDLDAAGEEAWA
jgi:type I restriction enzyme, S subunit